VGEPAISAEGFLEECRKWLSDREMDILERASVKEPREGLDGGEALVEWQSYDNFLREQLVRKRKERKEGKQHESGLSEEVKRVFEGENPLDKEKRLAQVRMDFIDSITSRYFFDLNWLVLYYLKVQIMERLSTFEKDKGEQRFYKLCEVTDEK
jgi:hypothetical protein